mgnify:CR=1 FL=1
MTAQRRLFTPIGLIVAAFLILAAPGLSGAGLSGAGLAGAGLAGASAQSLPDLNAEWPKTDLIDAGLRPASLTRYGERDPMPPLNDPGFLPANANGDVGDLVPVITVTIGDDTKIYPLPIVAAHGIVNDRLGGEPIAVSYCRVCAAAMVFGRRIDGETTTLGLTGLSREHNLILYDRATETWWQQINGNGLAGKHREDALTVIPSRLMSLQKAVARHGKLTPVMTHSDYSRDRVLPKLDLAAVEGGNLAPGLTSGGRVLIVDNNAYRLADLREAGVASDGNLIFRHQSGRYGQPDAGGVSREDLGDVSVYQRLEGGELSERAYTINLGHVLNTVLDGQNIKLRDLKPVNDPYAPENRLPGDPSR